MLQVKTFDEESEKDLEFVINNYLKENEDIKVIDIKYQINSFITNDNEQIYCYSALIIYRANKE